MIFSCDYCNGFYYNWSVKKIIFPAHRDGLRQSNFSDISTELFSLYWLKYLTDKKLIYTFFVENVMLFNVCILSFSRNFVTFKIIKKTNFLHLPLLLFKPRNGNFADFYQNSFWGCCLALCKRSRRRDLKFLPKLFSFLR